MARRDRRHGRPVLRAVSVLLVLTLAAGAAAAYRLDLIVPWYDHFFSDRPAAATGPEQVPPPPGLELPPVVTPAPVADALTDDAGQRLRHRRVERALAPHLADPDLGRHVLARVTDLGTGRTVYNAGSGGAVPASTTKLLTTVAALDQLGPEHTFETSVVSGGKHRIVLVGGGDPFLAASKADAADAPYPARADVETLARRTAKALRKRGTSRVRLGYDDSLFSGSTNNPHWPADYLPDGVVSRVTALWVGEGRSGTGSGRVADPSLTAATVFAGELARRGVQVTGVPEHGVAASGGERLAAVQSAPLREIVERILLVSDNEAAEVLGHQVGVAVSGTGSFAAGAAGVVETLDGLGVPTGGIRVYDGSGLSREGRIAPAALIAVLATAVSPDHPALHTVAAALPVAGFTGSLATRFGETAPAGRGTVRAKTGTLTNVTSLAGIATTPQGQTMLFVLMADKVAKVDETDARDALDEAAGALGACRCAR